MNKMNLEHLYIPDSKEAQKISRITVKELRPNMGQFEFQEG